MQPDRYSGPTVTSAARAAVMVVAETLAPIPRWARGEFVGIEAARTPGPTEGPAPSSLLSDEPYYDVEEGAWIFGSLFVFGAHPSSTREEYRYRLRYLRNRVAQPEFETADAMEVDITIIYAGEADPSEVVVGFEYEYAYSIRAVVEGMDDFPLAVDAAGTMRGCNISVTSTGTERGFYQMSFAGPIAVHEGGCAEGSLPISFASSNEGSCRSGIAEGEGQPFDVATVFDGDGAVVWTVSYAGEPIGDGAEAAPCQP